MQRIGEKWHHQPVPANTVPGTVLSRIYTPTPSNAPLPTSIPPSLDPSLPQPALVPIIVHILAPAGLARPEPLSVFLARSSLAPAFVAALASFGAIWVKRGPDVPSVSPKPLRATRASLDDILPAATPLYARIHAVPRRHRARGEAVLLQSVALESGGVLHFFNKPPGVPIAPSVDNVEECLMAMAEEVVGETRIVNRLDVGTSGVVGLGDGREAVRIANEAMKGARKSYLVLTEERPVEGILRHWVRQEKRRGAGVLERDIVREWGKKPVDEVGGWLEALLEVESVEKVGDIYWESRVRLVTGRTHQIRIQFAAQAHAVAEDNMYGKLRGDFDGAKVPLGRIVAGDTLGVYSERHGLHAMELEVELEGTTHTIKASKPWWRLLPGE